MRDKSYLDNLIRTHRYSGNLLVINESVSDHVWCMNALAMEYIPKVNQIIKEKVFDLKDVIYAITLHDLDEVFTTDIIRTFKHYNQDIESAIQRTVNEITSKNLPEQILADLKVIEDKTTSLGMLVKIFDTAQAGYKMISEIQLGNKYFKTELLNVNDCLCSYLAKLDYLHISESERGGLRYLCNEFLNEFNTYIN